MKTRIEIYEIDRPQNIVASGSWNRQTLDCRDTQGNQIYDAV